MPPHCQLESSPLILCEIPHHISQEGKRKARNTNMHNESSSFLCKRPVDMFYLSLSAPGEHGRRAHIFLLFCLTYSHVLGLKDFFKKALFNISYPPLLSYTNIPIILFLNYVYKGNINLSLQSVPTCSVLFSGK